MVVAAAVRSTERLSGLHAIQCLNTPLRLPVAFYMQMNVIDEEQENRRKQNYSFKCRNIQRKIFGTLVFMTNEAEEDSVRRFWALLHHSVKGY